MGRDETAAGVDGAAAVATRFGIELDAADVAAGPVATVELPFRVPAGLHGNWFSPR